MIRAARFVDAMLAHKRVLFTGVPCSLLSPLMEELNRREETEYIPAANEGEAVAIAAGAWCGGKVGAVLCQNSGLGNMVNPLASLCIPYRIPVLLIISWRGKPGEKDEPQHQVMGSITQPLLELLEIPWRMVPQDDEISREMQMASDHMEQSGRPFAFIVQRGGWCREDHAATWPDDQGCLQYPDATSALASREMALRTILSAVPRECPLVITTGHSAREVFSIGDREQNLYCVGSMGYASAVGHGVAKATSNRVYVIDGDGAALMHLGNVATIGFGGVSNLTHIVLDNGCYESTGRQPSASPSVEFAAVAKHCGYRRAVSCSTLGELTTVLAEQPPGPEFIHMKIASGSMAGVGRPTIDPADVARRFRRFLTRRYVSSAQPPKD